MTVIVLGTRDILQRINEPPPDIKAMIRGIQVAYCPKCDCLRPVSCYRYRVWFTYFWIPCCPIKRREYFLGCSECEEYLLDTSDQENDIPILLDSEVKEL